MEPSGSATVSRREADPFPRLHTAGSSMTIASMGKRHTALLGLIMCTAGCGWSPYPTAIPSSPPTASLPVCQAPELSPSVKELAPPTGLNPIAIRLTNVGDPCTLHGYPSLIFVSTHLKRMNFHITHTADQVVRGRPATASDTAARRLGMAGDGQVPVRQRRSQSRSVHRDPPRGRGGERPSQRSPWLGVLRPWRPRLDRRPLTLRADASPRSGMDHGRLGSGRGAL